MVSEALKAKTEGEMISYLLFWVGEKGRDIFNTFHVTVEEKKKVASNWEKLVNMRLLAPTQSLKETDFVLETRAV